MALIIYGYKAVVMSAFRENFSRECCQNVTLGRITRGGLRRIYWASKWFAQKFGVSILFLDPVNLKQFSISRFTPSCKIENLLRQLRPIQTRFSLIRIGDTQDGGYLVPADFDSVIACFSAGCDNQWSFEKDLQENYNIPSNIIDEESKRPIDLPSNFTYTPAFLGAFDVSGTVKFNDWISELMPEKPGDLILQMDIEGFEWESIFDARRDLLDRFSIIVIEFHGIENLRNLKLFNHVYSPALKKILLNHAPVHIHGNNCCGSIKFESLDFPRIIEVTFLRKDRIGSDLLNPIYCDLPNPLDSRNIRDRDELLFNW